MGILKAYCSDFLYGNKITSVFRILVGVLLLFAGIPKIFDPPAFGAVIMQYEIIPGPLVPYAAILLPYIEILIGMNLVIGFRLKATSLIGMTLMAAFIYGIAINLYRGRTFDCGCFNFETLGFIISEEIGPLSIVRNAVMLFVFFVLFRAHRYRFSVDGLLDKMHLKNI